MLYYFFKKQIVINALLFLAALFFVFPLYSFAASGSLETPRPPSVEEQFVVDVFVETEGENINSIDASVVFPSSHYSFEGYDADEGVVSLWVVKPHETVPGEIQFSGVIPGGVERLYDPLRSKEKALPVARLLFRPLREGQGGFVLKDVSLLRNDGRGSLIAVPQYSLSLVVLPKRPLGTLEGTDTTPPLPFIIEQIEGSLFGKTPAMLSFNAMDKDSGIDHYEVSIGRGRFVTTSSPLPVPHRLLPYSVTVRAVDFAGNYQEASIVLPGDAGTARVTLIAIVSVIAIVIYVYRRRIAILK